MAGGCAAQRGQGRGARGARAGGGAHLHGVLIWLQILGQEGQLLALREAELHEGLGLAAAVLLVGKVADDGGDGLRGVRGAPGGVSSGGVAVQGAGQVLLRGGRRAAAADRRRAPAPASCGW